MTVSEFRARLAAPVDAAPLKSLRAAFGLLMAWRFLGYWRSGDLRADWVRPVFHFTYPGFHWIRPLPSPWMHALVAALILAALLIAAGRFSRAAAAFFCLGFTYTFLLDEALYQNHLYLICLLSGLMLFAPERGRATTPAWTLWLFRFQFALPYFFGGVAKLNADWLRGQPLRIWLSPHASLAVAMSYGGLLLDLFIVPLLSWRRTRLAALAVAIVFHLTNAYLFDIGVFPWLMIAGTLLFMPCPALAGPRVPLPPRKAALLAAYVALQCLLPLRHFLHAGNPSWTERGDFFAWRMKLREKPASARFFVERPGDPQPRPVEVDSFLAPWQAEVMPRYPDMLAQCARRIAERERAQGRPGARVHALATASLNGRPVQEFVDPAADLASGDDPSWVIPLKD